MLVQINADVLPPTAELQTVEEFDRLSVRVVVAEHVWLSRQDLIALSGRGDDAGWLEKLDAMFAYAASKGWVDDRDRVRAHVEKTT